MPGRKGLRQLPQWRSSWRGEVKGGRNDAEWFSVQGRVAAARADESARSVLKGTARTSQPGQGRASAVAAVGLSGSDGNSRAW
jgi:hypothetical protein